MRRLFVLFALAILGCAGERPVAAPQRPTRARLFRPQDPIYRAPRLPQQPDLHPVVLAMRPSNETSPVDVARFIRARVSDPRERVRALHDWVADRIVYDPRARDEVAAVKRDASEIDQRAYLAAKAFDERRGVCAHFAALLWKLGTLTGDEIVYVLGDARSDDGEVGHHAWNVARVGDRWELLDVTWDAGEVHAGAFLKAYSTEYLFVRPEVFVRTHLPDDRAWQLLPRPVTKDEFEAFRHA